MSSITLCVKPDHRIELYLILNDLGFNTTFYNIKTNPYVELIDYEDGYWCSGIREIKGNPFVHFKPRYLGQLRLIPKEAIITFLSEVCK